MPDIHDLEKRVENLSGRVDELKSVGIEALRFQISHMNDRMNRQESYIKELLQSSQADRLSFVESLKNLEIAITKLMTENIKTLELAYKQDREKQAGFNMMVAQRIAQGVLVVAVGWFMLKDMMGAS